MERHGCVEVTEGKDGRTVLCLCGRTFTSRPRQRAIERHVNHMGILQARVALRKAT